MTLAWVFGSVWSTTTTGTPLTLFAQELGTSDFQFGLLTALPFLASLVCLPASLLIERTGRRKPFFLSGLYLNRALWLPLALAPLWVLQHSGAPAATRLLLWLMLIMYTAGAFGGPAWASWMADVVPERLRGRYFARRRQWGNLSAIPIALLAGWLLDRPIGAAERHADVLRWCSILFVGSAILGLLDISLFQPLPETPRRPRNGGELLSALRDPLRRGQFLLVSAFVAIMTFSVSLMGQFITLYLIDKVHVRDLAAQIILVVAPMVVQLIVLPAWGDATDRMGTKPVLTIAALGLIPMSFGWCWLTPNNPWLGYALSIAGTALWTGIDIANFSFVLEISERRAGGVSAYFAVNSVMTNIAGCLGGLAAGLIAGTLGNTKWHVIGISKPCTFYDVLFAGSGAVRIATVVILLPLIHEPSARSVGQTAMFLLRRTAVELERMIAPLFRLVGRATTPERHKPPEIDPGDTKEPERLAA